MYRFLGDVSPVGLLFVFQRGLLPSSLNNVAPHVLSVFFGLSFKEESSSGLAITFFTLVHVVHVHGTNSFSTLIVSGYFNPFESSETICTS